MDTHHVLNLTKVSNLRAGDFLVPNGEEDKTLEVLAAIPDYGKPKDIRLELRKCPGEANEPFWVSMYSNRTVYARLQK